MPKHEKQHNGDYSLPDEESSFPAVSETSNVGYDSIAFSPVPASDAKEGSDGMKHADDAPASNGVAESSGQEGPAHARTAKSKLESIDATAEALVPGEDEGDLPPSFGRKVNIVLCVAAFLLLFGYLFIAGEGEETLHAISSFNWAFLLIALVVIVVYWLLESACMQIISNYLYPGFSFVKTVIVTIIGQYFNCITPLSSGGQPMQAYYYKRFGMPLSDAMTMLLVRFIVYQFTMTIYAVIVLILRFRYFTETLRPLMYLVAIGFLGGLFLMAMLLALAFAKNTITKAVGWIISVLANFNIIKDRDATRANAIAQLEDAYNGIRVIMKEPSLLVKVSLVSFVQLTVFFSMSFVIFAGFNLEANDYFTVLSCQAFIYLISSFVPLPGAVGAAEGSYIVFFNAVYGAPSIVALSAIIWRLFTFYLPIMLGMALTLMVNNPDNWLAKWIAKDNKEQIQRHADILAERARVEAERAAADAAKAAGAEAEAVVAAAAYEAAAAREAELDGVAFDEDSAVESERAEAKTIPL
ncbi:MAG: flippase-like domain-containing protein [Eggerthellaceae bacterium]|nr:flippase-like domain-containing protein [Eggerthellaceae bacterium]